MESQLSSQTFPSKTDLHCPELLQMQPSALSSSLQVGSLPLLPDCVPAASQCCVLEASLVGSILHPWHGGDPATRWLPPTFLFSAPSRFPPPPSLEVRITRITNSSDVASGSELQIELMK